MEENKLILVTVTCGVSHCVARLCPGWTAGSEKVQGAHLKHEGCSVD